MPVWCESCRNLSQLPNMPRGPDLNATPSFWKPNFAEWDRTLEWKAVGRRLTALMLGFGPFATQASHHALRCDRFIRTGHPANRCALSALVVLAYLRECAQLPRQHLWEDSQS